MTKPKEPTREEMLEFIKDMEHWPDWDWEPESLEILQAIRRLIEKYGGKDEEGILSQK